MSDPMPKPKPAVAAPAAPAAPEKPGPQFYVEDVKNLLIALRNGGLLAMRGNDLLNVANAMARCEAVVAAYIPAPPEAKP